MAELLIPLMTFGGLYVMSNQENNRSSQSNSQSNSQSSLNNGFKSSNLDNTSNLSKPNIINQSNHNLGNLPLDKSNAIVYDNINENKICDSQTQIGLTGNTIDRNNFTHNNMQPFFGATIKGANLSDDQHSMILDNKVGAGTYHKNKEERAPLFAPKQDMHWAHGQPNRSDFYMSRQNPSTKMANTKPWEEVKVAPGLGQGYTAGNSGSGYNTAVEDRNSWLPYTVDQLRVATNPKISYQLAGYEGIPMIQNKQGAAMDTFGKVEKCRPDTMYEVGPDRWFTTTGAYRGNMEQPIHEMPEQERETTTAIEFFGNKKGLNTQSYQTSEQRLANRQCLGSYPVGPINSAGNGAVPDHGHSGYSITNNNRTTTVQPDTRGPVSGIIEAVIAPVLDILRPTKKENVVGTIRPNGNVGGVVGAPPIYNPADRLQTTIKEQTVGLLDNNHLNIQPPSEVGYHLYNPDIGQQHRDSTNRSELGGAAPITQHNMASYEAGYNQRNDTDKTAPGRLPGKKMDLFNNKVNYRLNTNLCEMNRTPNLSANITHVPSTNQIGVMQTNQIYSDNINNSRMDSNLLSAFKKNPYTQSLQSVA